MALILGIETSCDDTGIAVFDTQQKCILSNVLYSQIDHHEMYGGVVPEIASRSQLERINGVLEKALRDASITLDKIDAIAVTHKPGLVGSLLVGVCFAKALAWTNNIKLIGIDHLEGHVFSAFLKSDFSVNQDLHFPFITLSASGGHSALHLVEDFGKFRPIGQTLDDAAGEAFDKIAKMIGYSYPGGPIIEKLAREVNFQDFYEYPRIKRELVKQLNFSFSGLKTAVLYDLVKKGAYDLKMGPIKENISLQLQQEVASSLLVCIGDIFCANIKEAIKQYPDVKSITFVGGVACNKYLRSRLFQLCERNNKKFFAAPSAFCMDNGGMISFVGSYKYDQKAFSDLYLDVMR